MTPTAGKAPQPPAPSDPSDIDRWILAKRPNLDRQRGSLPTDRPARWISESEPDSAGQIRSVLTVFLTNRECPWRCLMCDLWRHTTLEPVAAGAIPRQVQFALDSAPAADWIKLYNAGSFFDAGAVAPLDYPAVATLCRRFQRVIVECHPSLVGPRVAQFRDLLAGPALEVALGLETVHPAVLARLNKRMTSEDFARAAGRLRAAEVAVRAFVLIQPPYQNPAESLEWAVRSAEFAFASGAEVVSLIPTRLGNGALDELAGQGWFAEPSLDLIEDVFDAALNLRRGRVFLDLWDLERFGAHAASFAERRIRLAEMNHRQRVITRVSGDRSSR